MKATNNISVMDRIIVFVILVLLLLADYIQFSVTKRFFVLFGASIHFFNDGVAPALLQKQTERL